MRKDIKVTYSKLGKSLGLTDILTEKVISDSVDIGFEKLNIDPKRINLNGMIVQVGFSAAYSMGQASYFSGKTVFLGAYRSVSDDYARRNIPRMGKDLIISYFPLLQRAILNEMNEIEKGENKTSDKAFNQLVREAKEIYGPISLRDIEFTWHLAHEINHYMRPRKLKLMTPHFTAFRETTAEVIGQLIKGSSENDAVLNAATYGYEMAAHKINGKKTFKGELGAYCMNAAESMLFALKNKNPKVRMQSLTANSLSDLKRVSR